MAITNKKDQRLISLLTLLNNEKNLTVSTLSALLSCSKSTILNDLNFFSKNWADLITISINKEHIIEMESTSNGNTNKIIRDIIVNSLEIQFIRCLFLFPNQNIYFYSEKLYTSSATLYRIIKHLKSDFKELGVIIENNNKTYQLKSENNINLLLFLSKGLEEFYGLEIPIRSSQEEFDLFSSSYFYSLDEEHHFMYLIWGIIQHNNQKNTMIDFKNFKAMYDTLEAPLDLDNQIDLFFQKTKNTFSFSLDAHDKFKSILLFCLKKEKLLPVHKYLFINRHQSFVENFAKLHTLPFSRLKQELEHLLKQLEMNIDFSFNYIFYLLFTHCQCKIKNNKNKHIYIYSDLGRNHSLFLKSTIEDVLSNTNLVITVVEHNFFENYIYQTTDLIISTTIISNKIPTIFVDDYLCEAHFFRIRKELKSIH